MRSVFPSLLLCAVLLAQFASVGRSESPAVSWPTFRGADRTAVAPDTGLLAAWPEGGPKLVWESAGAGRGYASVAIAGGRIYTLGDGPSTADDKDEYLTCFNQANGRPLWKAKTGEAWNEGDPSWQGSRSTPSVDANRIYVRFRDTGVGIDPEEAQKVFEPFYTTKRSGTGLGLAVSYGIVQRHGGEITVESSPGRGATFVVSLPIRRAEEPAAPETVAPVADPHQP